MKTKRTQQLKQAAVMTLLLFAAMVAVTGIAGLIPLEQNTEPAVKTEEPAGAQEVFAILPQEETTTVFAGFEAPLQGVITSAYGYRNDPFSGNVSYHKGVDVAVPSGTEVRAVANGTVTASAYNSIGGNYVILTHENGTQSYYGHLQTRTVAKGDTVQQGDIIGLSGATGKVTGPHLHFQLSYNERTVDPQKYLDLAS